MRPCPPSSAPRRGPRPDRPHRPCRRLAALLLLVAAIGGAGAAAAAAASTGAAAAPATPRWQSWAVDGFTHITDIDGLPNEVAAAVSEDRDGFIWVGTMGGVARWDGFQFKVHKFDPDAPGALPDNVVQVLFRDARGTLWVGTSTAGLARYDAAGERFAAVGAGPKGLGHVSVRAIADDGAGGLWVATDGGLDHVDPASGGVRHVSFGATGLRGDSAMALLRDHRGRLWVGTSAGLFRRDAEGLPFEPVALPAPAAVGGDPAPTQAQPETLLEDSAGRIWIGTNRSGAFVIDAEGAAPRPVHESAPDDDGTLQATRVMALLEARPGVVWIGTLSQGIVAIDTASGRTRRLRHRPLVPASLPDDGVRGLHRDRAGLVWVATQGGLARLDPRPSAVLSVSAAAAGDQHRARTEYGALMASSDGRVWIGTHSDGIEIVDPRTGSLQVLAADASHPATALQPDVIIGMAQVADGSVYIGSYRGLYRASADGSRVARVTWPGRKADAGVGPVLRDGPRLWIGGLRDGLWLLDTTTGRLQHALAEPRRQLTDQRITALAVGPDGRVWIGTRNGLNRFDPATAEVQRIPAGDPAAGALGAGFVSALRVDRERRLWVGTYGGGVHRLEPDSAGGTPRFRRVGRADGLGDDNVNALIDDAQGRLWASTDEGLAMIDPYTMRARALRRADGLVFSMYWTSSVARTEVGELLFGASGGMAVVRPELLSTWAHRPPVVVTELHVGGKTVAPGAPGTTLQVPADANSLSVEFAALDYSAPERNRYAHRLLGYESEWVATDAKRRAAAYSNLPPGRYELQLRGSNRDGVFSDTLRLPVEVLAAWHQTALFRVAAVVLALLVVWGVVHARTRLLQARRHELQRLVDARTAELQAVSQALTEKSLALEEKSRVLERASISDPLTGLHNRRFLTERIDAALAASLRRAQSSPPRPGVAADTDTLFFLIDVDHFKRVNDAHGHAAGDAVLVQVAQRLSATMRESDDVVRWGGEEFLAVARDTDRARADELAERIRAGVADTPFRLNDGRLLSITCSVGHACWPFLRRHPQALDWLGVVNLADTGLLAAKRLGRNAWVGLHGTDAARPEGLPTRAQATPLEAWRSGEIAITSSHSTTAAVAEALTAH